MYKIFYYARVSTQDQNLARQLEAFHALGADDRLSRNKADIRKELQWFQDNKIRLKVIDLPTTMMDLPEGQEWILI